MANVKGQRRRYDSVLRQEQARQTRARILDAAQKLFADRGFANATMGAIASGAGVATDTVYATFRNKQGVLHALLDVRVAGDELPIGVLDREGPQAVKVDRSQARQVARFAEDVTGILERARPVDDIMRGAAAVDPDIAALRSRMQEGRGMSEADAATIAWAVASPEVHGLLRVGRGWTQERYRDWLAATLTRTLLP